MDRRTFLKLSSAGVLVLGSGVGFASCGLQGADANGLRLLPGFRSRKIATTGEVVPGTGYTWHSRPDGGAVFDTDGGGWIYVSNSETIPGGTSMIRFNAAAEIVDARRILSDTLINCAGGATPWGTWLSCEELDRGKVWECDPLGEQPAIARTGLGLFKHEAAAVDPVGHAIYLTEDEVDGALYRFLPNVWGNHLSEGGVLEVMTEIAGVIGWAPVPNPEPAGPDVRTRNQVAGTKRFNGGEGTVHINGSICFTTKGDNRVWRYTPSTNQLVVVYDFLTAPEPMLSGVDNITALPNGDLFVAEDGGDMEIVRIRPSGSVERVVQLTGVVGSEIAGPAFSPDLRRLYFSSQSNPGVTYEVTGPWT